MSITLDSLRHCLDGAIPGVIATCARDGTPNVANLSQVHYIDSQTVALSFQFFNKTRENVQNNPYATVQMVDPHSGAHYRLALRYVRTETEGPLFENMKAKLAGIASHTGMSKVFRLLGSDIYDVLSIETVPGYNLPCLAPEPSRLPALRACSEGLMRGNDMGRAFDLLMQCLGAHLQIEYAMLLMADETGSRLYTVASRGYPHSGVGSEIRIGDGIIGVAGQQRTAIRISYMAREYHYTQAVRRSFVAAQPDVDLETEIPFPGLTEPHSQLAVPILHGERLLGVLYVESPDDQRFGYEDEDVLTVLANHLALITTLNEQTDASADALIPASTVATLTGKPALIRHFPDDDSVFIDDDYLIKGVAGAILWKLLRDYVEGHRTEFSNRELRRDTSIPLPEISANLEARLILLHRRLAERAPFICIEKTGRGRFRLGVTRPVQLVESPRSTARH